MINHTPGFGPEDFNVDINTRLFLGPAYCMIRPKFLANRKKGQIETINSVLVTLGMSNSGDLLSNTLAKVLEAFQNAQVYVLPGGNTLSPELNHEYLNIKEGLNEDQMVELLDSIDLAIVPMSTIYLEALSRGVLVAGGYFTENQHIVYNEVVTTDLIYGIGDFHNLTVSKLIKLKNQVSSQLPTRMDANLGSGWNKVRELVVSWIK